MCVCVCVCARARLYALCAFVRSHACARACVCVCAHMYRNGNGRGRGWVSGLVSWNDARQEREAVLQYSLLSFLKGFCCVTQGGLCQRSSFITRHADPHRPRAHRWRERERGCCRCCCCCCCYRGERGVFCRIFQPLDFVMEICDGGNSCNIPLLPASPLLSVARMR